MKEVKFSLKRNCCDCCQPIVDGRNSKTCTKGRKCRDCNGKYPAILHGLQVKKNDKYNLEKEIRKKKADKADSTELISASTRMNQVINMCVVPVKVRSKILNTEVKTWDMLNNCIQGRFVKETLLEKMKVEGKSTIVTVKSLNEDCKHSSLAVDD